MSDDAKPKEDTTCEDEVKSTSSSEYLSPTVPGTSELLRALCVDVIENQRWFPFLGWATSRLSEDLPNFTISLRFFNAQHTPTQQAFASAFVDANPEFFRELRHPPQGNADLNGVPQRPLSYQLPSGYEWEGEWYVTTDNPRGCDAAGWRYGPRFDQPGSEHRMHFKKTWNHECVVRRRAWRRYVHLAGPLSSESLPHSPHDTEIGTYIREKEEEMMLAESLKAKRARTIADGGTWTSEDDLAAEEELRNFVRSRRERYSTTNRLSHNPSFANPFEQDAMQTASETVPDTASGLGHGVVPHALHAPPPDTAASTAVTDFRHYEPEDAVRLQGSGQEEPMRSISAFLPSVSPVTAPEQQPSYPINVEAQGADFDAIFSKFVNNPETAK